MIVNLFFTQHVGFCSTRKDNDYDKNKKQSLVLGSLIFVMLLFSGGCGSESSKSSIENQSNIMEKIKRGDTVYLPVEQKQIEENMQKFLESAFSLGKSDRGVAPFKTGEVTTLRDRMMPV